MPIIMKFMFFTTTLWSVIYSVSYTVYQYKKNRPLTATTAAILMVLMIGITLFALIKL